MAVLLLFSAVGRADTEGHDPTSGKVALFPFWLAYRLDGGFGEAIEGHVFPSGDGWWLLDCKKASCSLRPARAVVTNSHYAICTDGPDLNRQSIAWVPPATTDTVAAFKPIHLSALAAHLVEGKVTTFRHQAMTPGGDDYSSLQAQAVRILTPAGEARLMVRPADDGHSAWIELSLGSKRQRLGKFGPLNDDGSYYFAHGGLLGWAGDLDGDGRLDVIVNSPERDPNVDPDDVGPEENAVLYLSTLAKPGEVVGEAGRFRYTREDCG